MIKGNSRQRSTTEGDEKPYFLENETYIHNYFKKIKPSEISFKQNHSHTHKKARFDKFPNFSNRNSTILTNRPDNYITQKMVIQNMKLKKQSLQTKINKNLLLVNKSFNRYFQIHKKEQGTYNLQRKKNLGGKNLINELIKMGSQKKIILPTISVMNQKNILQMTGDISYEIFDLPNSCLDTTFLFERYGPSLQSYQNQLILYGGFATSKKQQIPCFHRYNLEKKLWIKVQDSPSIVPMTPCFHTIDIYRNYMILVGGVQLKPGTSKRKYNSDVCVYSFQKKQWFKLKSSIALRSHASTLFGNTLLIHGGIDEKQTHSNQMHFINFNQQVMSSSLQISTTNKLSSQLQGFRHDLAHHKLVNTHEIDSNVKMMLKYDGVFCFGGIDGQGNMHNEITFLNCIGKQNALDIRFQNWMKVQCIQPKQPQARKNHSLNIVNKRALVVLVGGQNNIGTILHDIWIFDLIKFQWKQVLPVLSPGLLLQPQRIKRYQGVAGHCTAFIGTKLCIFGGRSNIKDGRLWGIQTQMAQGKKRLQKVDSSNVKDVQCGSMWHLEI